MTLDKAAMLFAGTAIIYAVTTALVIRVGVAKLDQATALQCITNDWPREKHHIHMDWCAHNGYPTK